MSFNGSFDPYAVIGGQRMPVFLAKESGKLARLTRFSFSVRGSLNSRGEGNTTGQPVSSVAGMDPSTQEQLYLIDPNPEAFVDFNLLWSLSFGYSFNYSRSEEHTSELQSLMRISYAVFCLNKKNYSACTLY